MRAALRVQTLWVVAALAPALCAGAAGSAPHRPLQDGTPPAAPAPIVLGLTTPLSGPRAAIGNASLAGVRAAIAQANSLGGIEGRQVQLVALDDGADPARTGQNMLALAREHGALAVFGPADARAGIVAAHQAERLSTPLISLCDQSGAQTGRWVYRLRATPADQGAAIVDDLLEREGIKPNQVALVTERSARSQSAFEGIYGALLKQCGCSRLRMAHSQLEPGAPAVEGALADIILATPAPRAIVVFAPPQATVSLIRAARSRGVTALFVSACDTDGESLAAALGPDGEGVIVASPVPPAMSDSPAARGFLEAMPDVATADRQHAFEAYLAARRALAAMRSGSGATREGFAAAMHGAEPAGRAVWTMRIEGSALVPLERAAARPASAAGAER